MRWGFAVVYGPVNGFSKVLDNSLEVCIMNVGRTSTELGQSSECITNVWATCSISIEKFIK
jgi:hypothetical protein